MRTQGTRRAPKNRAKISPVEIELGHWDEAGGGSSTSSLSGCDDPDAPEPSQSIFVAGRSVEVWNDDVFLRIRQHHSVSDDFLESVPPLLATVGEDGKGGHAMYLTQDQQFIIKELPSGDHRALLEASQSFLERLLEGNSFLCPIYLHFCEVGDRRRPMIVIRNLMPENGSKWPWSARYDLKACADDKALELDGEEVVAVHKRAWQLHMWCPCFWTAQRQRYYDGKMRARNLFLDISPVHREAIWCSLAADVDLFASQDLMDYSLLLGIQHVPLSRVACDDFAKTTFLEDLPASCTDTPLKRAVNKFVMWDKQAKVAIVITLGFIDYLQTWSKRKVMARYIKFLERNKSTIPPDRYCARFKSHFQQHLRSSDKLASIAFTDATRILEKAYAEQSATLATVSPDVVHSI